MTHKDDTILYWWRSEQCLGTSLFFIHIWTSDYKNELSNCMGYFCFWRWEFRTVVILFAVTFLRLVGGDTPYEGSVQVFHRCLWSSIRSSDSDWGMEEANVVCRQLGYSSAFSAWADSPLGPPIGPPVLTNVVCDGDESRIDQCRHELYPNLNRDYWRFTYESVGVNCTTPPSQSGKFTIHSSVMTCSVHQWHCHHSVSW